MWDYVYGLLSPEENQEMVARIKSDPQVARLYAEVRLQGELVAQAAIVEDQSLHLTVASAKEQQEKFQPAAAVSTAVSSTKYRSGSWLTAIAASALVLASLASPQFPVPVGVLAQVDAPIYEDLIADQEKRAVSERGPGDIARLLTSGDTWTIR